MRCGYCGEEIDNSDPNYGITEIHEECAIKFQDEMCALEMIEIVSRSGKEVSWALTESFKKSIEEKTEEIREHAIQDETIDDDIITLLGIVKAVDNHISDSVLEKNIPSYASFIFNGLMVQEYGFPIPKDKLFSSRMHELKENVTSIEISEEEHNRLRKLLSIQVPTAKISKDLDKNLTKAVLDIIEEIADKFEEDFEASPQWRRFRTDELLLQTIQNIAITHLRTAPSDTNINLSEKDIELFNRHIDSIFKNIVRVSVTMAKRDNVPTDVILARVLPNIIINLIEHYIRLKIEYTRRHS